MGIEISIRAGVDQATSSVSASGSVQHVITDTEKKTFGLQDADLKNAIAKYHGKKPNDAYLHSETPWGDLYKKYNWPQVQTVLVVDSATITGITSEPTIISTKTFTNDSTVTATFNAGISDQVSDTTESTWSETNTISVEQSFSYNVAFLGAGGGGETSMSYSHEWGQGGSQTKSVTVGSDAGVSVSLKPGESVDAQLTASRGVMKVRIVYKAYLVGDIAANYNPTYKGHHFWALDIGSVMGAAGLQKTRQFTEDIEVGYYSNSKIVLTDTAGQVKETYLGGAKAA
jgi:hypothetical protein